MAETFDSEGVLRPDIERLTRFGRFLRTMSIDELPELLNVIRGEMSIVGPRPLLMQYLERYSPAQARRHNVLPGMTGWAQINGRNAITWEDKFRYDVWYVDHWTFWFDMKIIALTFWKVLLREGINEPGRISAGEFMGTERKPKNQNMNG
jgi:lipopolysaccharide/colanic/teichoic acid biosynthesis glycosyltransferase